MVLDPSVRDLFAFDQAHFTLEGARVHAVWVDNRSVTQNHLYYNRTRPF